MSDQTVHVRGTSAEVRQILSTLPQEVSGGDVSKTLMTTLGLAALGHIREAFIVKSRGGTDEAGDRWAPLSPKTVAGRRGGRTKTEKKRSSRPSQALTKKQQARWWSLYKQGLGIFRGDKGSAAKRAWGILKREGATTLLEKYGSRQVDILRDTGLLLSTLSPGSTDAEHVFRVGPGEVIVGTNRKGAVYHHNGVPGRLPQRRLWPEPTNWPDSWWQDIAEKAQRGVIDIVLQILRTI